jgi:hemolysin activation/secretion protein
MDPTRSLDFLGGNGALRGFPSNYISGTQSWGTNLELRTIPLEFKSVHIGAAAFLDAGSTFSSPVDYGFLMSTGVGARIVFPQFNRNAIRIDAGIPITQVAGVSPFSIVIQFGQAFK